ncbi:olfactory receptor 52E2-like [Rana temporaria]|uniref:olfactory receptor 52E2-like n=1 Tax=Rana temporaria TaxID=8407 RepID=UPI001AAC6698|nr:olfactory receptor 52E2-like [Rana temporaria]
MDNTTTINDFILLGLFELDTFGYFFSVFFIVVYLGIILLSSLIAYIVRTEKSLHEPMYILICNLVLNGIFGSTSIFPKLIVDLITSSKNISRVSCLVQIQCVTTYIFFEISTFAVMAYDRYLAVCHPLQYVNLMSLEMLLKLSIGSLVFCILAVLVAVLLSARLPLCGRHIKSVFCDNVSFFVLSCVDSSVNNLYGTTITVAYLCVLLLVIFYSYIRIFVTCWTVSKEAHKKAIHTLLTHVINFSIFLMGLLFVFIRHRLGSNGLSLSIHTLLSLCLVVVPPIANPFIYGVRTKALRDKIGHFLQSKNVF